MQKFKQKISSRYELVIAMSVPEALKTLGLRSTDLGDKDKIKKTYRQKALDTHPDRGGSEDKMKLVNQAYDVLQKQPAGKSQPDAREHPTEREDKEWAKEKSKKASAKVSAETLKWLNNQIRYGNSSINTKVRAELEPYKMKSPKTLYLGIYSDDEEIAGEMPYFGDEAVTMWFKPDAVPESWTPSMQVARYYSRQGHGGYFIEYEAKPEDSIVDLSLLPSNVKEKLITKENEVVLLLKNKIKVIARSP